MRCKGTTKIANMQVFISNFCGGNIEIRCFAKVTEILRIVKRYGMTGSRGMTREDKNTEMREDEFVFAPLGENG